MTASAADAGGGQPLRMEDVTVTEPSVLKRAVGAAALGNVTEWYDFGVYGYLATTIEGVFIEPYAGGSAIGLVITFGLFAVSFLVRPFGGLFFGPLGDRIGRKRVLSITIILMAFSTFAIGLIPDPGTIGIGAPLLLLAARVLQGFSTGGEYGSAMTFISEYSPDKRRGFWCSFLEFGTLWGYVIGATFATLITTFVPQPDLNSWGWRIPFLIALPIGVVGLLLRIKLEDTPAYNALAAQAEEKEKEHAVGAEFRDIFAKHWPAMLLCIGLVATWNVTNYMLTNYMPSYLEGAIDTPGKIGTTTGQVLQIVVLAVLIVLVTFIGRLSDRIGRKPIIVVGCIALVVLSFPSLLLIQQGTLWPTLAGLMIMGLMLVVFSATQPSTLPALFPTHIRSGGLSIAFNISVSLFGGTTSFVMSSLVAATGDLNWPAYYLIFFGIVGIVSVFFLRESSQKRLEGSPPSVTTEQEARELVAAGERE